MPYTKFGAAAVRREVLPDGWDEGLTGAALHVKACAVDTGVRVRMIGQDTRGRRFTREAKSLFAGFAIMRAVSGLATMWLVNEDGSRRLVASR